MFDLLLTAAVQAGSLRRIEHIRREGLDVQARVLRQLLRRARNTEWGQRYAFGENPTAAGFAERVPVSTYEQLYPELERVLRGEANVLWPGQPRWFAKSSG